MTVFKLIEDIEEKFIYNTRPHIPNWSKYSSSYDFS